MDGNNNDDLNRLALAELLRVFGGGDFMVAGPPGGLFGDGLNNNASDDNRPKGASKAYLKKIPRLTIHEGSSILNDATVNIKAIDKRSIGDTASASVTTKDGDESEDNLPINNELPLMDCTTAEFGPPVTQISGTLEMLSASPPSSSSETKKIAYADRGGGTSFVQKALNAQKCGYDALIIGNNVPKPWPFIMKDSQKISEKQGLNIPVVMIHQKDAIKFKRLYHSKHENNKSEMLFAVQIQSHTNEGSGNDDKAACIICTDPYQVGDVVIRLPPCYHAFHEKCALKWLEKHSTCPYCRTELPTDDPVREENRRAGRRTENSNELNQMQEATADDLMYC